MSQYTTDYVRYAWQMVNGFRVKHELSLAELRERDIQPLLATKRSLKVLDVANGRLRPQLAILKSAGHEVYGIDLANRPLATRINYAYSVARQIYRWKLDLPKGALSDNTLLCGNAGLLPFPSESFDLATSIAAFEHFLDVPSVVEELYRVLRPGAFVWVCIHLFTSLSGGHNLSFAQIPIRTIPSHVHPWDHLRERRLPFHVPLNEWRMSQYVEEFGRHFELVRHYCALHEGDHFLTPELKAELKEYSRDELTCYAYIILARKPE